MTQNDFARLVSAAHARLGFSGGAGVQVGQYSALPHGSIQPQVIKEERSFSSTAGAASKGMNLISRARSCLGAPRMKQVFAIERKAQDAALAAAKPGVPCEAVDAAARKVIEDAGSAPATPALRIASGTGWAWTVTNGRIS